MDRLPRRRLDAVLREEVVRQGPPVPVARAGPGHALHHQLRARLRDVLDVLLASPARPNISGKVR